jgi:hypothetical protein
MPQSLHSNFAHIVFSTKNREPMIGGDVAGRVHSYIQNQAEHHKKVTFQEEYRRFLNLYNIEYDERYVWD